MYIYEDNFVRSADVCLDKTIYILHIGNNQFQDPAIYVERCHSRVVGRISSVNMNYTVLHLEDVIDNVY